MSTPRIMMKLGQFSFSLDTATFHSMTREKSYRWPKQERPGQLPHRQYLGPDADTMTLPGTMYPHYAGGLGQVDAMRTEAGKGEPLLMVAGSGEIMGYWCILKVRETSTAFLPGGVPRKIEFSLSLEFYGRTK